MLITRSCRLPTHTVGVNLESPCHFTSIIIHDKFQHNPLSSPSLTLALLNSRHYTLALLPPQQTTMNSSHFLLLFYPGQGQINPVFHLAKLLTRAAVRVTLATTVKGLRRLTPSLPALDGISYASFSDGYDDDDDGSSPTEPDQWLANSRRVGSQSLTNLLVSLSDEGRPATFIVYSLLLPWVASVAREMHVPSAFLWIQCVAAFAIYHKYFNSNSGLSIDNLSISIELPGLPLFSQNDIPTVLLPSNPYAYVVPTFQEHIRTLEEDPHPCILANTFDALEQDSIKAVCENIRVVAIGPLVSDPSLRIDLFEKSTEFIQFLDSKPERSVVYVSFGSLVVLKKTQIEEIFEGLIRIRKPFLWVIRSTEYVGEVKEMIEGGLRSSGEDGLIVPWCSQSEVLFHRSIGCFVTHCGWNSTLESLVAGVPMVGCPHFSDQPTNAKLVDEVWGVGVRASANQEGVVERGELERCLGVVMGGGERGEEIRRNAVKWRGLAGEAVEEGGSSHNNLKQFLETLG